MSVPRRLRTAVRGCENRLVHYRSLGFGEGVRTGPGCGAGFAGIGGLVGGIVFLVCCVFICCVFICCTGSSRRYRVGIACGLLLRMPSTSLFVLLVLRALLLMLYSSLSFSRPACRRASAICFSRENPQMSRSRAKNALIVLLTMRSASPQVAGFSIRYTPSR